MRIETRQRKIQVSQIPYLIYFLKSLVSIDTIPRKWEFAKTPLLVFVLVLVLVLVFLILLLLILLLVRPMSHVY